MAPVSEIHHPVELSELRELPGAIANLRCYRKPTMRPPLHPVRQNGERQRESQFSPHDRVVTAASKDGACCIEDPQFITVSIQAQPTLTERPPQLDGERASRLPPAETRGQAALPICDGELARRLETADRRRDRLGRASDQETTEQQGKQHMKGARAGRGRGGAFLAPIQDPTGKRRGTRLC